VTVLTFVYLIKGSILVSYLQTTLNVFECEHETKCSYNTASNFVIQVHRGHHLINMAASIRSS